MRKLMLLVMLAAAAAAYDMPADLAALFQPPVALVDKDGKEIVTRRATGHAVVADWNGDGTNDIILGAKVSMDTGTGAIWFMQNTGTNAQPRFAWPAPALKLADGKDFTTGCG